MDSMYIQAKVQRRDTARMQAQRQHKTLVGCFAQWHMLASEKQAAMLHANELCRGRQKTLLVSCALFDMHNMPGKVLKQALSKPPGRPVIVNRLLAPNILFLEWIRT